MPNDFNRIARDLWLNWAAASIMVPSKYRWLFLRLVSRKVEESYVSPRCFFGGRNIEIGKNTFINYECFFDTQSTIQLGKNVRIGMRCLFVTGTHEIGGIEMRAGATESAGIVVGDGVWIGANSTILPGVQIGMGAVIAAGSLVTRDVPANTLSGGSPARVLRDLGS